MNIGIHVVYDTFFAIIFMLSSTFVCKFINNESRSVSSPSRTHSNAARILVRMACNYYCNLFSYPIKNS